MPGTFLPPRGCTCGFLRVVGWGGESSFRLRQAGSSTPANGQRETALRCDWRLRLRQHRPGSGLSALPDLPSRLNIYAYWSEAEMAAHAPRCASSQHPKFSGERPCSSPAGGRGAGWGVPREPSEGLNFRPPLSQALWPGHRGLMLMAPCSGQVWAGGSVWDPPGPLQGGERGRWPPKDAAETDLVPCSAASLPELPRSAACPRRPCSRPLPGSGTSPRVFFFFFFWTTCLFI